MKTITIETIRSYNPCYDPEKYLAKNWSGTVIDILSIDEIPWEDRLWAVMRNDLVSDKLMRLFALWCARQVQHLMTDDRSLKALDVVENFANGLASKEELSAARDAARDAAWDAARDAAMAAARAAAMAAAMAAAWDAAWDAARDAARDAAMAAARAAAMAAARDAAWDAQKSQLIIMILEGEDAGDVK